MRERPLLFGELDGLLGVLSEPAGGIDPSRPIVMMLNAGLIHHVGPNRLHVRLARRLASDGLASFRVDLSGRGDSAPRRDALPYIHSGIVEVRAAMDRLQQLYGATQFVLLGICAGADTAGQVGCVDPRVVGLVVIEGAAYPTRRSRRRYFMKRALSPATWLNTVRGTNRAGAWFRRRLRPRPAAAEAALVASHHGLASPTSVVAAALQGLVDREVEIFTVYTGSSAIYNYVGQVRDAFPQVRFGDRLREGYYPRADHTFTRRTEQARFIGDVAAWMNDTLLAPGRRATAPPGDVWEPRAGMTEVVHL